MTAADTIFAVSSGTGRAAIAVLRISGSRAGAVLERLTETLPAPRLASLRTITDPETGDFLDQALVLWFPGPHSATGEDIAELHLHGSHAIVVAVISALSRSPGIRPAEPGEFTRRAFLNGRMDLVQVEGLGDLLEARTAAQRKQAYRQMAGHASTVFDDWRHQLLMIRSDLEAAVDFVEEPGVAEEAAATIDQGISDLLEEMKKHLAQSASAEIVRDGVRVVLAGRPNTGKSSILNALARRDAAIVSSIPGTTRDAIEISMDVAGFPVILTDTAGLRPSAGDPVEEEGIRRSRKHIAAADVVLWVVAPDVTDSQIVEEGIEPDVVVCNKADLTLYGSGAAGGKWQTAVVRTSAVGNIGMTELLEALSGLIQKRFGQAESSLVVTARQRNAVETSIRFLNGAQMLPSGALELKAEAIRQACDEIGRLTGRIGVEEWLGVIFSRFCIGK